MDRRSFLRTGVAGLGAALAAGEILRAASGAASGAVSDGSRGAGAGPGVGALLGGAAHAGEPKAMSANEPIDADALAAETRRIYVDQKRTCAEALVTAGLEALGIESDLFPDMGLGLAGGVGLQGQTCGLITGAALVLSAAGARIQDYKARKRIVLEATRRVAAAFTPEPGSTQCRNITGLDYADPKTSGASKKKVKAEICAPLAERIARVLARELTTVRNAAA